MSHWKVTFYQKMSVRNFLGAFLVTILAFRQRMHSWNVFTLTVVLLWEHQIQKKNHSPNWSSKRSAKSMDKQSRQPIRKVRPERIESHGIKSWFALWHSKSLNSTPSMMLSLMVLKLYFRLLKHLEPLYLTIYSLFGQRHKTWQMHRDFFFFFLCKLVHRKSIF